MFVCTGCDEGGCFLSDVCAKGAGNRGLKPSADALDRSQEEGGRTYDLHLCGPGATCHPHHFCEY